MNYLSHIFLSGDNRQLQVGNFIGDFVKGKSHENYPPDIQRGILLHREIDRFTDSHPVFLETVEMLRPVFNRYSGIVADMYFDHFLASDFKKYNPTCNLRLFSYNFYLSALLNYSHLPNRVKGFIFHFIGTNRLLHYSTTEGLHRSLQIMSHYKSSAINPNLSISFLQANEEALKTLFERFMPEVIQRFKH
ncbi:MAG: ACP phosphodiesterase [Bacteroidales bacterium]|nr:ACP phosphodiesterase [Bacteroidales bacterium]